ncbi:MAG TPA: type II toxin-antitoxin system VapC family toxin [Thermoanaerobaculia bacterium]|nr:type II toxin-antitoxin system VapC family toxin [Thermoanaerobaculia bacterium]
MLTIDASLAIRAAVDGDEVALDAFAGWSRGGVDLVAPDLWLPESITAVRRSVAQRRRSAKDGEAVIGDLFDLPIRSLPIDRALGVAALRWAARLGQHKAYDALYLAVAERHEVPLVTADDRLLARCQQLGIDFVQGLPEQGLSQDAG